MISKLEHFEGLMLVYDITDASTFDKLNSWIDSVRSCMKTSIPIVLVGAKKDLKRAVPEKKARAYAEKHKFSYIEASSKSGEGVEEAFMALAVDISNFLWVFSEFS